MEKIVTDIVVLGTGGAGMAAALTAAEGGAKVVILEKRPFAGGTSTTPMCVAVTKKDQAYRDQAFQTHMDMVNWQGNPDLVRNWIETSGDIPEFLENHGYNAIPTPASATLETMGKMRGYGGGFPNGYFIHDVYFLPPEGRGHGGATMIKAFVAKAKELGIDIRYSTPAKKILKVENKVTGVLAEDKEGNTIHVDAKAVIIATGGFNDDAEMIKEYIGYTLDPSGTGEEGNLFWMMDFKLTGDGQKMAWEVGADRGSIGCGAFPHVPGPGVIGSVAWSMVSQARILQEQPYLWVNQNGKRFMDESLTDCHVTHGSLVYKQPGKSAYMIWDQDTTKHMEEVGIDHEYFVFKAKTLTDIEGDLRTLQEKGNKHVFIADTLEELAAQMQVDYAALKETIDTYNSFCDKKHDDQYGKNPQYLKPVRKGKFFALRTTNTAYQTIGGIKINGNTEALTKDNTVIGGLYGAGDAIASELFGNPPTLGQGFLTVALSTGMIAGKCAIEYINN